MSCHLERVVVVEGRGWSATVRSCKRPRGRFVYSGNEVEKSEPFIRGLVERAVIKAFKHKDTCVYCIDR